MSAPDYRPAACCLHCYYHATMGFWCIRYSVKVDIAAVCATFTTKEEVEGESQ